MAHKTSRRGPSRTVADKSPRKATRRLATGPRPGKGAAREDVPRHTAAAAKTAAGKVPRMTPAEIAEAFRRFQLAQPEPKGELAHGNPFTLLVAVVLSAQATDAGVNKATPALFAAADTPAKMAALGEERVRDLIKSIGLFRTKARNVVALSRKLLAEHGGQVPHTREALETLPGVGRKTANVVLNIAFGEPTIAVDTHIFRVGNCTGMAPGKTPFEVEMKLEQAVPRAIQASCPPLADPARALHLRGAPPALRAMPDRGYLQVAGEDAGLGLARCDPQESRAIRSGPSY